jgi:hypothetical protein
VGLQGGRPGENASAIELGASLFLTTNGVSLQVTMIGKNEADRRAAGDPQGLYFIDVFALN